MGSTGFGLFWVSLRASLGLITGFFGPPWGPTATLRRPQRARTLEKPGIFTHGPKPDPDPPERQGDLESVSGGGFAPTTQTVVIPLSLGRIWVGLWSVRKDYGLL